MLRHNFSCIINLEHDSKTEIQSEWPDPHFDSYVGGTASVFGLIFPGRNSTQRVYTMANVIEETMQQEKNYFAP